MRSAVINSDVPEITSPLLDIIATDGESTSISCKVAAPLKADVTWYKESRLLRNTPEFGQSREGELLTLTIAEVFADDEGKYR